jgi:serine/threonine protein kinase
MLPSAIVLERYELLRELSKSDGGATYKAVVRSSQKSIAVRSILPHPATSLDISALLQNAIKARALNSPYIVHLLEAYESEGIVYLVMDYTEGALLAPALGTPQISDWELADASRQICSAIDHASSLNVFHQNLHPGNVIQEWDGTVKLLDYGVTTNPVQRAQSNPGAMQCLQYVSPEQARGEPLDRRSNLFSWGAILYEMVTGKKAFPGDQVDAILEQITNSAPAAPHKIKGGVHPGLSKIIMRSLANSPGERYQTGSELLYDLDHYKEHVTIAPKSVVTAAPPPVRSVAPVPPPIPAPQPIRNETRPLVPVAKIAAPPKVPVKPVAAPQRPTAPEFVPLSATPHLAPTPRSEFLIVGPKPSTAVAAPVPAAETQTAAQEISKPPEQQHVRPSKTGSNRPLLVLITAIAGVVLLLLVAVGIILWLHRDKPASQNAATQATPQAEQPVPIDVPIVEPTAPVQPANAKDKKKKTTAPVTVASVPMLGNLSISSAPEGATIEIDGQTIQFTTPHTAPGLAAGAHTLRVSKAGYEPVTRSISVQAGQTVTFNAPLTELRATLAISSDPEGALISINGEKSSRVTPATVMLLKGRYAIALSKQGFLPAESSIDAVPGQSYKVAPHLTPLGNADAVKDVGKLKKFFGGGDRVAQMGKVQFKTVPKGAAVSVNGKPMKKQTPMELFFPGGTYELMITLPGYKTVQKTITVTENATQAVDVQLERELK